MQMVGRNTATTTAKAEQQQTMLNSEPFLDSKIIIVLMVLICKLSHKKFLDTTTCILNNTVFLLLASPFCLSFSIIMLY